MCAGLRAVLVGCGSISETWRQAAADLPGLTMVAFVDLELEAARRSAGYDDHGDGRWPPDEFVGPGGPD